MDDIRMPEFKRYQCPVCNEWFRAHIPEDTGITVGFFFCHDCALITILTTNKGIARYHERTYE